MEEWKDIRDYEGLYRVSNQGRIYNILLARQIALNQNSRGYCICGLTKDGKSKTFMIHRLVAIAFLSNPLNKSQVNHKNGIKSDNRAANLEWCTGSENMYHAYRTGLQVVSEYQKNAVRKHCKEKYSKKVIQFDFVGNIVNEFPSASEAARQTGYCQTHISSVCRGKVSHCHNYKFKYA